MTLKPFIQGHPQSTIAPHLADFKSVPISPLLQVLEVLCETNLQEIIVWESSDVVKFDLGSLLSGQTRGAKLKSAYNFLIIGPRGLQCETKL